MFPFDKPRSVKWLFDHIRNYIIVGVVAHGSHLLSVPDGNVPVYGYALFFLAGLLLVVNAVSGAIGLYYWLKQQGLNFIGPLILSLLYFVIAVLMCTALFFASLLSS